MEESGWVDLVCDQYFQEGKPDPCDVQVRWQLERQRYESLPVHLEASGTQ